MHKILLVSPAYNEAEILPRFIEEVFKLQQSLREKAQIKLLVVNDGSADQTLQVLEKAAESHPGKVGYLSLAYNSGHQAALTAALTSVDAWADAVITLDCDLEHPLEVIPKMIDLWSPGDVVMVNTIRTSSEELSKFKRFFSKLFYKTTSLITGISMVPGQADYRLWDARVLRTVAHNLLHMGSIRVFSAWLPGKKAYLEYKQVFQSGRQSRFTFKQNLEFWKVGIVRFSKLPLRLITFFGVLGILFSVIYGIFIIIQFATGKTVPGWTSLALTVIFMGCTQLVSLGIVATYLNRLVFAKDLPPFVIRSQRIP
jgi:polyisoprenyl-phosphate glycosyltransferase